MKHLVFLFSQSICCPRQDFTPMGFSSESMVVITISAYLVRTAERTCSNGAKIALPTLNERKRFFISWKVVCQTTAPEECLLKVTSH